MPRVKISEFKAKSLLYPYWKEKYEGKSVNKENLRSKINSLDPVKKYVLKVDEGIKKRKKSGLMFLNIQKSEIESRAKILFAKGFNNLLVEEYVPHEDISETYFSLELTRNGVLCSFSEEGGINIEDNPGSLKREIVSFSDVDDVARKLGISPAIHLKNFLSAFNELFISFLEVNPLLINGNSVQLLDCAVEVDSAGEFFVKGAWDRNEIVENQRIKLPEEMEVKTLAQGSSASFKLVVLNPKGSLFTLFSGGGASIVLADEVENIGLGKDLANYAEYSGGPNEEETYLFAKSVINLALKSPAKNKKIIIAGGVANFTDIRATFKGIIKALDEKKDILKSQKVKVYVRRGGPFQEEGLLMMADFLKKAGLTGEVMGPERVLTEVITIK